MSSTHEAILALSNTHTSIQSFVDSVIFLQDANDANESSWGLGVQSRSEGRKDSTAVAVVRASSNRHTQEAGCWAHIFVIRRELFCCQVPTDLRSRYRTTGALTPAFAREDRGVDQCPRRQWGFIQASVSICSPLRKSCLENSRCVDFDCCVASAINQAQQSVFHWCFHRMTAGGCY